VRIDPRAGTSAPAEALIDPEQVRRAYYAQRPDGSDPAGRVSFGTSGHRGSSLRGSFNEGHILAITQAICEQRKREHISGPLFIGRDTHVLSEPALQSALEVLIANEVEVLVDRDGGYTPTPVISHAILTHNRQRPAARADGIVITPSHNPPEDGGFKYNPPHGGPADTTVTRAIEDRANALLSSSLKGVARTSYETARHSDKLHRHDYIDSYVADLGAVLDLDLIRAARLKIGVDPLGGAAVAYWGPVAERYGLDLTVVDATVDPTFRFMPLDWDGKIRMDCSSRYAMAKLIALRERYDIAFGNDTDADRHGIVTHAVGLMPPNDYLAAAISYLFAHRPGWRPSAAVGKTMVSSGMIDRVAGRLRRSLLEVPVGFKWFVTGLGEGTLGFGGEESAGAAFLRHDGTTWTTDKDGLIMGLLAAEMMARTQRDPAEIFQELARELGPAAYERIDEPASPAQKSSLAKLSARDIDATQLAGEPIAAIVSAAPGNGAPLGGVKVSSTHGWFAARPSGTEAVYKLYAESFRSAEHLKSIQTDARRLLSRALATH
jgi:phosphoglucomutase